MVKFNAIAHGGTFTYWDDRAPHFNRTYYCRFCDDEVEETLYINIERPNGISLAYRCCPKEECRSMAYLIGPRWTPNYRNLNEGTLR